MKAEGRQQVQARPRATVSSPRSGAGGHAEASAAVAQSPFVVAQRKQLAGAFGPVLQRQEENETGMPDSLKSGVESLSGMAMDNVRVHYNSGKPRELNALAYAQGSDIHLGPGQEKHLPHEAWHVVQQAQGRVRPTMQAKSGTPINDDKGLEREADVMGVKARTLQLRDNPYNQMPASAHSIPNSHTVQRLVGFEFETGWTLDREHQEDQSSKKAELSRDEVIVNKANEWKLTAEEVPGKEKTVAEFKTHAVDETNEEAFKAVFDSFEAFVTKLAGEKATVRLNQLTSVEGGYEDVTITPVGELMAQPQMTGGIRLDRILHFMQRTDPAELTLRAPGHVQKLGEAGAKKGGDKVYWGVVALLAQYVVSAGRAEEKAEYPKGAISILSRMDLGALVLHLKHESHDKISPEKLVKDVLELAYEVKPPALKSLIDQIMELEETLNKEVKQTAWNSSVDQIFAKYEGKIDSKILETLKQQTQQDWTQRYSDFKSRKKNLDRRLNKSEATDEPLFSEAARKNTKIPTITAKEWLSDLADRESDSISWGFGSPTKTQTGKSFGLEPVGESKGAGLPLEVRSLGKSSHLQWRQLAKALVLIVRKANADKEPTLPNRQALPSTEARKEQTKEAPSRLGELPPTLENQGKKLHRSNSFTSLAKKLDL